MHIPGYAFKEFKLADRYSSYKVRITYIKLFQGLIGHYFLDNKTHERKIKRYGFI